MRNKNFRTNKSKNWLDKTTYGYSGRPIKDEDVKVDISIKSMRDLPKSSYALKADPYQAALPTSEPYPILNKFNRVIGGSYKGEDNIDGGNVQQYVNSTTSSLLKAFDEMRLKMNVNYRYLPIKPSATKPQFKVESTNTLTVTINESTLRLKLMSTTGLTPISKLIFVYDSGWKRAGSSVTLSDYGITVTGTPTNDDTITVFTSYPGVQLIEEMRKSIAESLSVLQATTFTQMAINRFAVVTDLPMGTAKLSDISTDNSGVYAYTSTTDVLYAISIYYQLFLQEGLSVMNWFNSFRLKQGTMIRNAWNREVPNLNAFFGLMNKKAFLSMLDSICLSYEGEYVDKEFMQQMNTLCLIPSRRSNSITDPVLEMECKFNHPSTFKIYLLDDNGQYVSSTPLFDDADLSLTINYEGVDTNVSFWDACDHLKDILSMERTQAWARGSFTPAGISGTDNARYNQVVALFNVIIASFTLFKPQLSDYREALDVMTRTGTISWSKGFRPSITKDTDVDLFWNVMVDHIYQSIFSGSHELHYDDKTKRWRTFSIWNMYSGIPSYDLQSGGSFLSLSFKVINNDTLDSEQFEYLPLLFEVWTSSNTVNCVALSRNGVEAIISQDHENIQNNVVLNRLAPLASQSSLEIRVPKVAYDSDLDIEHYSSLYKVLTQIFGSCKVQSVNAGSYDTALDPDILAIYQIEISDITNMSISYARANAPFRGTTSKSGELGFASIGKD